MIINSIKFEIGESVQNCQQVAKQYSIAEQIRFIECNFKSESSVCMTKDQHPFSSNYANSTFFPQTNTHGQRNNICQ